MRRPLPCNPVRKPARYQGCRITLDVPFEKPELAIYSQLEAILSGNQPTWDNPDIDTYRGSNVKDVPILNPLKARIRNLSKVAPASNALVHCDIGPFGIGTTISRISTQVVNVMPEQQIEISYPLPVEILEGDQKIAVKISIELPNDINTVNNVGEQVAAGGYSSVMGRQPIFIFPVVNVLGTSTEFSLEILDNDLSAIVDPRVFNLAPMEEQQVSLRCQIPDDLHPSPPQIQKRLEVTIQCQTQDGTLFGGLTCFVFVDD